MSTAGPASYRFHEITHVYGDAIKEMIHEKFGDGIMSAIDFDLTIDKVEHPKGDRVKVTMSGKFLPYNRWRSLVGWQSQLAGTRINMIRAAAGPP